MIKLVNLIGLLFILTFLSCDKEEIQDICIVDTLEAWDMILYVDQEIGCQMTLDLFEYKGQHYFMLDNYCMDMQTYIFDCEGNELCTEIELTDACVDFYEESVYIKKIGITQ